MDFLLAHVLCSELICALGGVLASLGEVMDATKCWHQARSRRTMIELWDVEIWKLIIFITFAKDKVENLEGLELHVVSLVKLN